MSIYKTVAEVKVYRAYITDTEVQCKSFEEILFHYRSTYPLEDRDWPKSLEHIYTFVVLINPLSKQACFWIKVKVSIFGVLSIRNSPYSCAVRW